MADAGTTEKGLQHEQARLDDENALIEDADDESVDDTENYGGFEPDDAVVKIATSHGWRPKDKLDDPAKFTPPDEFVENQWKINEATKSGKKRLEHTLEQVTRRLDQVNRQYGEMTKRDQDKAQGELRALRKQAIEEGDEEKVDQIQEQIDKIKETAANTQGDEDIDPNISDWMKANLWYRPRGKGANDDVQEVIEFIEELNCLDEYAKLSPKFRMAKIDREVASYVEMRHPNLIGKYEFSGIKPTRVDGRAAPKDDSDSDTNPRREISDVEGNAQRGGQRGNGKTYSSLSVEEKRACDAAVDSITGMTRKDWLKSFNEKFGS